MQICFKHSIDYGLRCFFILFITLLLVFPTGAQTQREHAAALIKKYNDYHLFNGAVLIAQGGTVIYKRGVGKANMSWDIPNTADTRFRIASSTKQFTAALVLTLVEEGTLELDGKITDYLTDYPVKQGEQVTIHHLLTHTSGIPSYTTPDFMANEVRNSFKTDSLVALFSGLDLQFEPGSRWSYSNSGYILLGAIIETTTGKPYEQVLRERILDPLGLEQTGYDHYSEIIQNRAAGYISTPGGYERAPYLDTSVPFAAGMMYSTVEDLYKWDQSLYQNGPFQKKESKVQLFKPHIDLPEGMSEQFGLPPHYGYGWFTGNVLVAGDTVKIIEHGGSIFGFSTGFWRMPEEQNTVIILDNTSSGEVRNLGRGLISILYGKEPKEPKQPISHWLHRVIESSGIDAATTRYKKLLKKKPIDYNFKESELNKLGYYYLKKDQIEKAVAVLELNVEIFPQSENVYDSLGEAYMEAGNKEQAVKNYRKSLALNPDNANARRMLQLLERK